MNYTVSQRGEASGFRLVCGDAAEALKAARDMVERGITSLCIRTMDGTEYDLDAFERIAGGSLLTARDIELIQSTCDVLLSANREAAAIFYDRLFQIAPAVRPLFQDDLAGQGTKLIETLGSMLSQLTHPEMFSSLARQLGRRHVAYGAEPDHYGPVGEALLASLAQLLGPRFTPDVRAAWTALYVELSGAMLKGGEGRRPSGEGVTAR